MLRIKKPKPIDKQLDELVKAIVHARDGHRCLSPLGGGLKCGGPLQASHILPKSRGQRARWDDRNVMTQCRTHHMFWWHGTDPIGPATWAVSYFGHAYLDSLDLAIRQGKGKKVDKHALLLYLLQRQKEAPRQEWR